MDREGEALSGQGGQVEQSMRAIAGRKAPPITLLPAAIRVPGALSESP